MYVILLRNKNAGQQGVDFVKYEIGDFVSKPVTGICKIENILYLNPQDEKNDKLYYLMKGKNICSCFKLRFKTEIMSDKRRSLESDQTNSGYPDSMDKQ